MITRTSKIAQLSKPIREDLNRRLENGKQGPELLKWLNGLPETKQLLAEKFESRRITHQNLSEWRRGGHQDWLRQQHCLEWFDHFCENETELKDHDQCGDTFEAMARIFLFEIGQGLAALSNIKNSKERSLALQNLAREFARLQNAYNFSRKTQLDFDKYNQRPDFEPLPEIEDNKEPERLDKEVENPTLNKVCDEQTPIAAIKLLPLPKGEGKQVVNCCTISTDTKNEIEVPPQSEENSEHIEPALPANPLLPIVDSGLKTADSAKFPAFQPIPTPAPTTPIQKYNVHHIPIRGRRFTGVDM